MSPATGATLHHYAIQFLQAGSVKSVWSRNER